MDLQQPRTQHDQELASKHVYKVHNCYEYTVPVHACALEVELVHIDCITV